MNLVDNVDFKENIEWTNKYPFARKLLFEPPLIKVDKSLENPLSVVKKADDFFFNPRGRRKIHPLDETTQMVACLMEQGLYKDYTAKRRLFTIPTIEFVHRVAEIIRSINPKLVLEAGAGDGSLSLHLKYNEGINIVAVDDKKYGERIQLTDEDNPLPDRPSSKIVTEIPINQALTAYQPDLVVAVWLVNPKIGTGDDLTILQHPSVKHFLWIGDTTNELTSTKDIWSMPGWRQTELTDLNTLFFTQKDSFRTPMAFKKNTSAEEIRRTMQQLNATQGRAVLFSRE